MTQDILPLAAETTIVATRDHMSSEHQNSTIVMSLAHGKYFGFDDIGGAIWKHLRQPIRLGALADALAAEYSAPRDTVLADLLAFAERLRRLDLIEVA